MISNVLIFYSFALQSVIYKCYNFSLYAVPSSKHYATRRMGNGIFSFVSISSSSWTSMKLTGLVSPPLSFHKGISLSNLRPKALPITSTHPPLLPKPPLNPSPPPRRHQKNPRPRPPPIPLIPFHTRPRGRPPATPRRMPQLQRRHRPPE